MDKILLNKNAKIIGNDTYSYVGSVLYEKVSTEKWEASRFFKNRGEISELINQNGKLIVVAGGNRYLYNKNGIIIKL